MPKPTHPHVLSGSGTTLVTPWHPIHFEGEWSFPCRIRSPSPYHMDCVYNVVLSAGHVIFINGYQFITLGHGNVSHPVLAHAFFGTQVSVFWSVLIKHVIHEPGCRACFTSQRQRPRHCHGQRRRQACTYRKTHGTLGVTLPQESQRASLWLL